ncbi:hypothetical protein F7725_009405, partial [Dissostichus mawsoni]
GCEKSCEHGVCCSPVSDTKSRQIAEETAKDTELQQTVILTLQVNIWSEDLQEKSENLID